MTLPIGALPVASPEATAVRPLARRPVLVVAGMVLEADAIRGGDGIDVRVAMGAAARDPQGRLRHLLPGIVGIVSFGTAGALDPAMRPGDYLLPATVIAADGQRQETDPLWRVALAQHLASRLGAAGRIHHGALAGADEPVSSAAEKAAWFARTGASAVDMESHALAALAAQCGLPFLVCRVVLDRADHSLPPAAMAGLTADGRTTVLPVIGALLRTPSQLGSLLRLARDAGTAQRALKAVAAHLPPRFAFPDSVSN